jgi:hypothetical protein
MIYRIKNGDYLRLLDVHKKDGSFVHCFLMTYIYIKSLKLVLYDNTSLLDKLYFKLKKQKKSSDYPIGKKYFYSALKDNELNFIQSGRTINELLKDYDFSFDSCNYLNVVEETINTYGNIITRYDKCFISNGKKIFNTQGEYENYIINNQKFYLEDYLNKLSASNNLDKLRLEFGNIFNELLAEERDKKINLILD